MDSYVFYNSFHEALKELPMAEYGEVLFAVNEYALNGIEPQFDSMVARVAFTLIKPQIDANREKRENGKLGGRPRQKDSSENEKPMVIEEETYGFEEENHRLENEKPNVNVNVNVNDNVNANVNANPTVNDAECEGEKWENTDEFQKTMFLDIENHNKSVKPAKRIPCSANFVSFVQKECRDIVSTLRKSYSPSDIETAFRNYLAVAKSDTWKKKFSVQDFCRNVQEYLPEFFDIDKFSSTTNFTQKVTRFVQNTNVAGTVPKTKVMSDEEMDEWLRKNEIGA